MPCGARLQGHGAHVHPRVGALIRLQQHPTNPAEDARIGLAGPLWGMGAVLACYLVFLATGAEIWAAIAHVGAFINIFNLIPLGSLDGGRGFRALSCNQAMLTTAASAARGISPATADLDIAVVAFCRSVTKPKDTQPDRVAFLLFLLLIAGLSGLMYVCGTTLRHG